MLDTPALNHASSVILPVSAVMVSGVHLHHAKVYYVSFELKISLPDILNVIGLELPKLFILCKMETNSLLTYKNLDLYRLGGNIGEKIMFCMKYFGHPDNMYMMISMFFSYLLKGLVMGLDLTLGIIGFIPGRIFSNPIADIPDHALQRQPN